MNSILHKLGARLARYVSRPRRSYEKFSTISADQLKKHMRPGDLLLVEGNSKVSTAIKYLTQSTWSHVCFYTGPREDGGFEMVEADLVQGVIRIPLNHYDGCNLRICRPVNLSAEDRAATIEYVLSRLGHRYDMRNIVDLMRYLLPTPPVPQRFRRRMLALGSGDPTQAICSTLVAQAFLSIKYPILPQQITSGGDPGKAQNDEVLLKAKHYSHFTPRDFDLSPYFEIVKPTIENQFDYKAMVWSVED